MFSVRHNLYKKASLEAFVIPLRRRVLQVLARVLAFLSILNNFEAPQKKAAPGLRGELCASFGISADAGRSLETVRKPQPPKGSQRGGVRAVVGFVVWCLCVYSSCLI